MAKYKERDTVEHPLYGTGEITKVTAIHSALSVLTVKFPTVTKELNAQWVDAHCAHRPYIPPAKIKFKTGVYTPRADLSQGPWQVLSEADTLWTEPFRQGLAYILAHTTPGIHLAMLGPYTVAAIALEEGETAALLEKSAQKYMTRVFHRHPDFGCIETPDGGIVLTMLDDALWFFAEPQLVRREENGKVAPEFLLEARQTLLNACYNKRIYALIKSSATP